MTNKKENAIEVKRGDLVFVDFGNKWETKGSEQYGMRPAVVIQNDMGNKFSSTTIVAPITKQVNKTNLPTHVHIGKEYLCEMADSYDSMILLEQVKVVGKTRVIRKLNKRLSLDLLEKMDTALMVSLGLSGKRN